MCPTLGLNATSVKGALAELRPTLSRWLNLPSNLAFLREGETVDAQLKSRQPREPIGAAEVPAQPSGVPIAVTRSVARSAQLVSASASSAVAA
jgi:hypothetical protein